MCRYRHEEPLSHPPPGVEQMKGPDIKREEAELEPRLVKEHHQTESGLVAALGRKEAQTAQLQAQYDVYEKDRKLLLGNSLYYKIGLLLKSKVGF
jgi:hypothetical protein